MDYMVNFVLCLILSLATILKKTFRKLDFLELLICFNRYPNYSNQLKNLLLKYFWGSKHIFPHLYQINIGQAFTFEGGNHFWSNKTMVVKIQIEHIGNSWCYF